LLQHRIQIKNKSSANPPNKNSLTNNQSRILIGKKFRNFTQKKLKKIDLTRRHKSKGKGSIYYIFAWTKKKENEIMKIHYILLLIYSFLHTKKSESTRIASQMILNVFFFINHFKNVFALEIIWITVFGVARFG
jgi:hypothetical protein